MVVGTRRRYLHAFEVKVNRLSSLVSCRFRGEELVTHDLSESWTDINRSDRLL